MDTVRVSCEQTDVGWRCYYDTDHQPGISGSHVCTDANPPLCVGTHRSGSSKDKSCSADLFTNEWMEHTAEIGMMAPANEALRRIQNGLKAPGVLRYDTLLTFTPSAGRKSDPQQKRT